MCATNKDSTSKFQRREHDDDDDKGSKGEVRGEGGRGGRSGMGRGKRIKQQCDEQSTAGNKTIRFFYPWLVADMKEGSDH